MSDGPPVTGRVGVCFCFGFTDSYVNTSENLVHVDQAVDTPDAASNDSLAAQALAVPSSLLNAPPRSRGGSVCRRAG